MSAISSIEKLVNELAKETVKESEAVGINSLNELKHIHANSTKLIEAESSMKKLIAKNADDSYKKLDELNETCLRSATAIESLIVSTQNQTRLIAMQTLFGAKSAGSGLQWFDDYRSYGFYNQHNLYNDIIETLKCFNIVVH